MEISIFPSGAVSENVFRVCMAKMTGQRWDPLYHQQDIFHFVRATKFDLVRLCNLVRGLCTGFAAGREDQSDSETGILQIRPTNLSDDRELVFHRNVYIATVELKLRKADLLNRLLKFTHPFPRQRQAH